MAIYAQDIAAESCEHVVKFYAHDTELVAAVGPYLAAAIRAGEVTIVIASETHRRAFELDLQARGIDVLQAEADGRFFSRDAALTMAGFIGDGKIDPHAFHEVIGGLVREASASGRPVRAYGEMVALLWDAGEVLQAIELETLWNDLAGELPFSLFCSYPAGSVSGSEHTDALQRVCHLHSSVLHACAENQIIAQFPAARQSPGNARRLAVKALEERGHKGAPVEDTALVISELATNAVLHAESAFSITLLVEDASLRVAVEDCGSLSTSQTEDGLIAQPGHGLGLIDAICTRWGSESTPGGKVVWAELPCQPANTLASRTDAADRKPA
jgi:anti-sigma regulatory factor (Ser/Thr protein kinase)